MSPIAIDISLWNTSAEHLAPIGMRRYLYLPNGVLNAVRSELCFDSLI